MTFWIAPYGFLTYNNVLTELLSLNLCFNLKKNTVLRHHRHPYHELMYGKNFP